MVDEVIERDKDDDACESWIADVATVMSPAAIMNVVILGLSEISAEARIVLLIYLSGLANPRYLNYGDTRVGYPLQHVAAVAGLRQSVVARSRQELTCAKYIAVGNHGVVDLAPLITLYSTLLGRLETAEYLLRSVENESSIWSAAH